MASVDDEGTAREPRKGGRREEERATFLGEGVEKTKKSDDGQRPGQKVRLETRSRRGDIFPPAARTVAPVCANRRRGFGWFEKGGLLPRPRAAHHPRPRHETPRRRARDRRRAAPLAPRRFPSARARPVRASGRARAGSPRSPRRSTMVVARRAAPLGRASRSARSRRGRTPPPRAAPEHRPDAERADAGRVRLRHERGVPGVPRGPVQGGSEQRPRVLGLAPEADGCVGATPAPSTRARPPERRPDPIDTTPRPRRRPTRPRPGVPRRPSPRPPRSDGKKQHRARRASFKAPSFLVDHCFSRGSFPSRPPRALLPSSPSPRRHHRPSPSPPLSLPPIITLSHQTPA